MRSAVHDHPQLFLKCRLPNRITVEVFDRCFCKVETRACETLHSCAKRLGGLEVTTFPRASRAFNTALTGGNFAVCTNSGAASSKIAETCSDERRVPFVNDSAVLKEPNTGCCIEHALSGGLMASSVTFGKKKSMLDIIIIPLYLC